MHYYTFNIGDYASHTKGLSLLEDLAYRRLLDEYYLAERPLNGCSTTVARMIGMRDHVDEVSYVLRSFFVQDDEGCWVNRRADMEIQHFKLKSEKASQAGRASAERRLNGCSTSVERPLNVRQLTNNQEPITNNQEPSPKKKQEKESAIVERPDCVDEQVWNDWLVIRKKKKAALTQTAWGLMTKEAEKAGLPIEKAIEECCLRSWASFKADWFNDGRANMHNSPPRKTQYQINAEATARALFPGTHGNTTIHMGDIYDDEEFPKIANGLG